MKNVSVSLSRASLVVLTLMAAACSVNYSSSTRAPAYAPPPNAYTPQYYPPPPNAYRAPGLGGQPATVAAPGFGPQPGAAPQPQAAPMAVAPGVAAFFEPINVAQIQSISSRNPKACGFVEVAPNVWTRVDCHAYAPSQRAVNHLSPRKALAVTHHTAQWKPLRMFGGTFAQAMQQGFSKSIFQKPVGATQLGVTGGGPAIVAEGFPAAVDHRLQGLEGPIKDQGPVGACTAFSLSTTLDNVAIRAGKMQVGQPGQAASANHVWAAYGYPQMGAAADANLGRSIAPMSLWGQSHSESCKIANPIIGDCGDAVTPRVVAGTFRQDPALVAKSDRADQGGLYKITGFEKLDVQPAKIEQIIQTLASGSDLWIAMKIDGFAWSNKLMKNGVIPDWNEPNGGHAVTMAGYRETPQGRQFLVHNNWGTSWGDGGYGWVSEAMVQKWMHFAYKVKIADGVKPQDVTDDDCAADEMIDLLKGVCAVICPDNTRPANGCGVPGQAPAAPGAAPPPGIPGFQVPPGFQLPPGLIPPGLLPPGTVPPAPAPSK